MPKKVAYLDYEKCRPEVCQEGVCAAAKACDKKLLKQEQPYEPPMAYSSRCLGCSKCVLVCPLNAIKMS